MAALSAARMTKSRSPGRLVAYKVTSGETVYAGGLVMISSAGTAQAAAASASNKGCVGVATATVTGSAAGETVVVQEGIFLFDGDSLAQTAVGAKVYADDDQTVDETQATNCPVAGICVEFVSASSAWVDVSLANSKH